MSTVKTAPIPSFKAPIPSFKAPIPSLKLDNLLIINNNPETNT